jgi:hypothetical protein
MTIIQRRRGRTAVVDPPSTPTTGCAAIWTPASMGRTSGWLAAAALVWPVERTRMTMPAPLGLGISGSLLSLTICYLIGPTTSVRIEHEFFGDDGHLGSALRGRAGNGDGVLVEIEPNVQHLARLGHG